MKRRPIALAATLALLIGVLTIPVATAHVGGCHVFGAGGGTWTTLQAGVDAAADGATLRVTGTCVGNTTIGKSLTIKGTSRWGSRRAVLDGNQAGPVLTIDAGDVTLRGLWITHGSADRGGGIRIGDAGFSSGGSLKLVDSTVTANSATSRGGGIYWETLPLTLIRSTVSANTADLGGGIGAVGGTVTLVDSIVKGNTARAGGGIEGDHGSLILNGKSSVHHNSATGFGGGIEWATMPEPGLILNDTSSVHDNTAVGDGGGISTGDGGMQLNGSSSVYGNKAGGDGGGIDDSIMGSVTLTGTSSVHHNTAGGRGGGVFNGFASTLILDDHSTIRRNAALSGGGVYSDTQYATLVNAVAGVNVRRNSPDDIVLNP